MHALNTKVGDTYTSQYTVCEETDIYTPKTAYTGWDDNKAHTGKYILNRRFDYIIHNTNFAQDIIKPPTAKTFGFTLAVARTN